MVRRVVITGRGVVSPLGCGAEHVWQQLVAGASGIAPITRFDAGAYASQIAGEVPRTTATDDATRLNPDVYVSTKDQRKMDDFIIYAIAAAQEALEEAGWNPLAAGDLQAQERTGVMIGSGIGGLQGTYDSSVALHDKGPRKVSPFFIPSCLINLASGHVSIRYGLKGPNHAVVTACATGAHALGDAARIIRDGDADVMVAGGTEAAVCGMAVAGFAAMRALSTRNDAPPQASRPWDKDRDGFVIGEGAGILVLEELEHALARGAKIYGELVGYGLSGDANHITAPAEDGDGAYRAMKMALGKAGITPADIEYINAHGTSTPLGDEIELRAMRRLYAEAGADIGAVAVSSTKSATGHLLGAAGGIEAVFTLMTLTKGCLPPTLNLDNPCEEAQGINLVPHTAQNRDVTYAMSNSFGFGGTNASLIFKRYA